MEKFNFYDIKIGRLSSKNNFIASHSFVCKVDSKTDGIDVYKHFVMKYKGFDVEYYKIETVIVGDIIPDQQTDHMGRTKLEKSLSLQVYQLKDKLKGPSVEMFKSDFRIDNWPTKVKENVQLIEKLRNQAHTIETESNELLSNHIKSLQPGICRFVRSNEGFNSDYDSYSYEMRLNGSLASILEEEKPEEEK